MGVMKQLKEEEVDKKRGKNGHGKVVEGGVYSFRPNNEQKVIIRTMTDGMVLAIIDQRVLEGIKFTLGHNPNGDGVYVIARKGSWVFKEGTAVGCNHRDVATALAMMAYYLEHVNPEYPAQAPQTIQSDIDW